MDIKKNPSVMTGVPLRRIKALEECKWHKGIGLVERAKARGVTLAEPPDSQREIDRMSGKRIAPDDGEDSYDHVLEKLEG